MNQTNQTPQQPQNVRFGAFEADLRSCELRKHGLRIRLQQQPFQILAIFLERPGELVTREELRQRLWPADTYVNFDRSLNTAIKKLRDALGDTADNPRFVETLSRRGYRFIAPVQVNGSAKGNGSEALPAPAAELPSEDFGAVRAWRVHWSRAVAVAVLLCGLLAAALFLVRGRWTPRASPPAGKTVLAVLPFDNLSGDPQQDYFNDGLTEEMIAQLGRLQPERLAVIARTSAMRYKGTKLSVSEIGRELHVDYVLEGSVRRGGSRVWITAQLIQVRDQTQLWAETYERDIADLLGMQREVAGRIARALALELLPAQQAALRRTFSTHPEAYEAYLKGRYWWNKRTEEGLRKSLDYFQQAIQLDPRFAPAYAGLADSHIVLASWLLVSPQDAFPKAKAAAVKALENDDTLAEAHASLGGIAHAYEWDWPRAEQEFRRAIELHPTYPTAHQWYAEYLSAMGRHEEAIAEIQKARELDPLNLIVNAVVGYIYFYARRYDDSIAACQKTLELDPNFGPAHVYLSWAYMQKGQHRESIQHRQRGMELTKLDQAKAEGLMRAYQSGGVTAARRWLVAERLKQSKREYVPAYSIAVLYAGLGERDNAFEWLEKAYQQRDSALFHLKVDPQMDPLRSDPRFQHLLRRMGLASAPTTKATSEEKR